jgi:hypothetical protein
MMNIIKKLSIFITMAFAVLTLSSCATTSRVYRAYTGDPLPTDQTAIVYAPSNSMFSLSPNWVKIQEVDGVQVNNPGQPALYYVELTPGDHSITVIFNIVASDNKYVYECKPTRNFYVQVHAEAGHKYILKAKSEQGFDRIFWRVDVIDQGLRSK